MVLLEKYIQSNLPADRPKTLKVIDIDEYRDDLDTLKELLSYDDPEALDILDNLVEQFSSTIYKPQFEKIQGSASEYDFEEALALFEKLLAEL